jgi:hypothetical protein
MLTKLFASRRPVPAGIAAPALDESQVASWERNGFLLLPGILSQDEVARICETVDAEWANTGGNDHQIDLLSGPNAFRTFPLSSAPEGSRAEAYKLNNLFARRSTIRGVALSARIRPILAQLLEGEPLICNSLNFERGSQQPFHIDSWYMPPPVEGRMVAAWFALDDVDATNGPLVYYPGSHRIPPYRFSHGRLNEIAEERPQCDAYLKGELEARALRETELHGKKGDVFIWHGQLLHGGRPIGDMSRTRRSMVIHYWRACDMPPEQQRRDPAAGSYLGYTLRGEIRF